MSFVMINTTNNSIISNLNRWVRGDRREYAKNNNWFIRKLGPNTYLMEANGATLALLLELRKKYNGTVYIYAVQPLHENEFPKQIRKRKLFYTPERFIYLWREHLIQLRQRHFRSI